MFGDNDDEVYTSVDPNLVSSDGDSKTPTSTTNDIFAALRDAEKSFRVKYTMTTTPQWTYTLREDADTFTIIYPPGNIILPGEPIQTEQLTFTFDSKSNAYTIPETFRQNYRVTHIYRLRCIHYLNQLLHDDGIRISSMCDKSESRKTMVMDMMFIHWILFALPNEPSAVHWIRRFVTRIVEFVQYNMAATLYDRLNTTKLTHELVGTIQRIKLPIIQSKRTHKSKPRPLLAVVDNREHFRIDNDVLKWFSHVDWHTVCLQIATIVQDNCPHSDIEDLRIYLECVTLYHITYSTYVKSNITRLIAERVVADEDDVDMPDAPVGEMKNSKKRPAENVVSDGNNVDKKVAVDDALPNTTDKYIIANHLLDSIYSMISLKPTTITMYALATRYDVYSARYSGLVQIPSWKDFIHPAAEVRIQILKYLVEINKKIADLQPGRQLPDGSIRQLLYYRGIWERLPSENVVKKFEAYLNNWAPKEMKFSVTSADAKNMQVLYTSAAINARNENPVIPVKFCQDALAKRADTQRTLALARRSGLRPTTTTPDEPFPWQRDALEFIKRNAATVVSYGTGSGKSSILVESVVAPILAIPDLNFNHSNEVYIIVTNDADDTKRYTDLIDERLASKTSDSVATTNRPLDLRPRILVVSRDNLRAIYADPRLYINDPGITLFIDEYHALVNTLSGSDDPVFHKLFAQKIVKVVLLSGTSDEVKTTPLVQALLMRSTKPQIDNITLVYKTKPNPIQQLWHLQAVYIPAKPPVQLSTDPDLSDMAIIDITGWEESLPYCFEDVKDVQRNIQDHKYYLPRLAAVLETIQTTPQKKRVIMANYATLLLLSKLLQMNGIAHTHYIGQDEPKLYTIQFLMRATGIQYDQKASQADILNQYNKPGANTPKLLLYNIGAQNRNIEKTDLFDIDQVIIVDNAKLKPKDLKQLIGRTCRACHCSTKVDALFYYTTPAQEANLMNGFDLLSSTAGLNLREA